MWGLIVLVVRLAAMAAMVAMLWPVGVSAQASRQTEKRAPTAPNPVVLTPVPPPPILQAPPPLETVPYQTLASAPVPDLPGVSEALVVQGNAAAILISRGPSERRFVPIDSVSALLGLLADRRAMPLWPTLIDWAGPGAEPLRDRQIGAARQALADGAALYPGTTAASASRPKARAALQLATLLDRAGKNDEALALLAANRPATPGTTDADLFEWVALTNRIAGIHREAGDFDRALAVLRDGEAAMGSEQFYSLNFRVNRAAYLAEMGRAADALATIDVAIRQFTDNNGNGSLGDRVPGSGREFSWIRACALRRLGRVSEADAEAMQMLADANPTDEVFVLKSTTEIAVRYARCIDDPKLAARVLASEVANQPIGASAFALLQPARERIPGDNAFFARVRAEPVMIAALGDRFRVLPDAFVPALNRWHPKTAPAAAPPAH